MASWLQRLIGARAPLKLDATVHRRESLSLSVPTDRAEAVRAGLERWFADYGITTPLTTEDEGSGKTRIRAKLAEEDATKLNLADEGVQSQLQDVIEAAVSSDPSSW